MLRYGAEGGTRTPTSCLTRPSNVRVYQFRHFGSFGKDYQTQRGIEFRGFYRFGCGVAVMTVENGVGVGAAVVGEATGVGVVTGASATPDCKTELVPVSHGSESISAISMKAAAAPIVIFASKLAVPRGPNAVLETELVNNAPASALPGCSNMTRIRTTHARMNNPYKT